MSCEKFKLMWIAFPSASMMLVEDDVRA